MTVTQFDPTPLPRRAPARTRAEAASAAVPRPRPAAPARPRLRVVEAPPAHRRLTRALTGLLVTAACAGLFAIVALRVLLAQGQGDVDRLEARATAEQVRQQSLRLTVAQLESPASVVAAARQHLGMVAPSTVISLTPAPAPTR